MKLKTTMVAMGLLLNVLNAQELNHQLHIGRDTYSGKIDANSGINLGYSYEWGKELKYAVGMEIIAANGSNESGDAIILNGKIGKEIIKDFTLYGMFGLAGMGTGFENSSDKKDVTAGGFTYGVLLNYTLDKSFDLQLGYKGYDLDYTLNDIDKNMHLDSITIKLIYKF